MNLIAIKAPAASTAAGQPAEFPESLKLNGRFALAGQLFQVVPDQLIQARAPARGFVSGFFD